MSKRYVMSWLLSLFVGLAAYGAGQQADDLLSQLDAAIRERPVYVGQMRARLSLLRTTLAQARTDEARYQALGKLGDAYKSFDIDSSMYFSREKLRVATRIGKAEYINDARLNMAEMMGRNGMYKEALEQLSLVRTKDLADYQTGYCYHVYRIIYGLMADNCSNTEERALYMRTTEKYRNLILAANPPESFNHIIVQADKYNYDRQYDRAIRLIKANYARFAEIHDRALMDYTLAEAYKGKQNHELEKDHLALSAISDMKSGIREYSSLRKLAVILYQEGDIHRAYNYLTLCMDDAVACNSRWRIYEVQQMFPIINEAYHNRLSRQQTWLIIALAVISLLSLFLIASLWFIRRQVRRVTIAKQQVQQANGRLHELNANLKELNKKLSESSYIKEEYIGHYIDQCSVYIEKMESYCKRLQKMAAKGKVQTLIDDLRSTQFIEDELKDFYANFDDTFLQLFPHFVEEFNALLVPEGQIRLKPGEKLNTELRIFALVRLGISSSGKIAHFLRYSSTTIYNYRVRIRNSAAGNREDFDKQVMKIGSGELGASNA